MKIDTKPRKKGVEKIIVKDCIECIEREIKRLKKIYHNCQITASKPEQWKAGSKYLKVVVTISKK